MLSSGKGVGVMAVDFTRYRELHPSGRRLIQNWFKRAWCKRGRPDTESFEPFIYCYISFNAWAACVTEIDIDRKIIDCLGADDACAKTFDELLKSNARFYASANKFHAMWPIFRASEIRRQGIRHPKDTDRASLIKHYLDHGVSQYEPHESRDLCLTGQIPINWQNFLNAAYRVRCNLFHGEKSLNSEQDAKIVGSAFRSFILIFDKLLGGRGDVVKCSDSDGHGGLLQQLTP